MRWALWMVALAACHDNPPFQLRFQITDGDSYQCISQEGGVQVTSCADVKLPCRPVISIRVVPPGNPSLPYISVCQASPKTNTDACAIAGVDLPPPSGPVPEQRLEVQMAVYADYLLPHDTEGQPICPPPPRVHYAANGFPVTEMEPGCIASVTDPEDPNFCWPIPALGGVAYYSPGDTETVVELGCTNPADFSSPACVGGNKLDVSATVKDFDLPGFSIPGGTGGLADRLSLAVGEPHVAGDGYVLNPKDVRTLTRTVVAPTPTWSAQLDSFMIEQSACIQILEDVPQSTVTLTCAGYDTAPDHVDIAAVRVSKPTLDQIVGAIDNQSATDPPFTLDKGLVIGLVLDENGAPAAGHVVTTDMPATIEYLTADRAHFIAGGTSTAGIFLSRDAPYGTTFATGGTTLVKAFGGLVAGKVTIVVLQDAGTQ